MISFTDKRLYAKGTCQAIASDPVTGEIQYFSNKFQTGNITTAVTMGEIRAGLGNAVAAIIPSDSAVNVEFTAADFNLWAKAAQVGATLNYNAPAMVCQVIEANGTEIAIDVAGGQPVAQLGYSDVFGYVQEVGAASPVAMYGQSYAIDPTTGAVDGFVAEAGKQYKVWYFVNKASARVASLSTLFNPRIVHFTAQIAVYANDISSSQNEGTRAGWLYVIVPRLKLGANGGIVGDQTANDTTSMSGQAVAHDSDVVSGTCSDCDASTLAYYVYVPDEAGEDIVGLAVIGGVISLPVSTSMQVPVKYVMANGELVAPAASDLLYALTDAPNGTAVSAQGVLTAGATAGDCEITVTYPAQGDAQYTCVANVSVTAAE